MRNDWALTTIACAAMLFITNGSRPPREQKQNVACHSAHTVTTSETTAWKVMPADLPLPAPGDVIRKNVEEVRVVFSVIDRQGHFVNDISPADLEVKDTDRAIDELTGFARTSNLPLRLGLVVDSSESMAREFGQQQRAAGEFLRNIVRPEYDRAFVMTFATRVDARRTYVHGGDDVEKLTMQAQSGGQTALYDAICSACTDELMNMQEELPIRRVLILLSDGEDTQSLHTLPDALDWAQRPGIAIYAITVHKPRGDYPGDRVLRELASATGGRAFILKNYNQLAPVFSEIESELRAQYVVTYRRSVAPPHSGFHPLQISVRNHPGLKVNFRRGYFAATRYGE